jgi:hypothetical protein
VDADACDDERHAGQLGGGRELCEDRDADDRRCGRRQGHHQHVGRAGVQTVDAASLT